MAELGSKGVTAGKIASNVQKKLTRAQEKLCGGVVDMSSLCTPDSLNKPRMNGQDDSNRAYVSPGEAVNFQHLWYQVIPPA
ncbi:hypothetical protein Q9233_008535 [Columba guinea]|nr:hypothetical protein Q9233_008535 [Columba guinea]